MVRKLACDISRAATGVPRMHCVPWRGVALLSRALGKSRGRRRGSWPLFSSPRPADQAGKSQHQLVLKVLPQYSPVPTVVVRDYEKRKKKPDASRLCELASVKIGKVY